MKLLIVDDSAMIRRAVATAYKGTVFTDVKTAADGLLAMTVFKEQLPDVVTLDITMPYMDGLAALSQMLEIKPDTVVLVISALADNHTAIEALIRGAQQFIYKPFTTEDLKEALDTLLLDMEDAPEITTEETETIHAEALAHSEQFDERISKATQRAHTVPSPINYPSGFVQPPIQGNSIPDKASDHTAVARQMSIKNNLFTKKPNL